MSYQVIARKWRPKTFEEIVGQTAAAQTLCNAILQNRIAHAYLFAGARGVGKTSTARILAKALNCIQGPTVTPCNSCPSCQEIAAGNSIDVLEIDAASNRGIDEIRELRENVKYAAARDRYKVFIIDEVHMLTTEAFNALLKTLEEPPSQVVFILATTEIHRVPSTILSRCQQFNFRAISYLDVLGQLKKIAAEEQIRISDEALNAIARASEGSMRDAQSLLEQIHAFCASEIQDDQVRDLLGIIPQQLLEEFTTAIAQIDVRQMLLLVDKLAASGLNLQYFVREMLAHLRNLLVVKIVGEHSKLPELVPLTSDELVRARDLSDHFSEEDLTRFFAILVAAEGEMRWSSQPRFHLEMALAKILQSKRLVPLEEVLEKLGGSPASHQAPAKASTQLPQTPATSRFTAAVPGRTAAAASPALVPTKDPADASVASEGRHRGLVENLKSTLAQQWPMVSSLLEHALCIRHVDSCVVIEFARQDRFSFEMLQSAENLGPIKEILASIAGEPLTIKILLDDDDHKVELGSSEEVALSESPKEQLIERVRKDSAVKAFLDTFHGEIADVKGLE